MARRRPAPKPAKRKRKPRKVKGRKTTSARPGY